MSDPKYSRLPHAGDFESVNGTEAFYLAPKPLPTGFAAFSGQGMHHDVNDVYLDFAPGLRGMEFAIRASVGSIMGMVIFFHCLIYLLRHIRFIGGDFFGVPCLRVH